MKNVKLIILRDEVQIIQKMGKDRENSYQKMKRSPEKRHTRTHGNLFEIF